MIAVEAYIDFWMNIDKKYIYGAAFVSLASVLTGLYLSKRSKLKDRSEED